MSLPSFLADAELPSCFVHGRTYARLQAEDKTNIGELAALSIDELLGIGLSLGTATQLKETLDSLLLLPIHRLHRLGTEDEEAVWQMPNLRMVALAKLCHANMVDDEIRAAAEDRNSRNTEIVLARWGFDLSRGETLDAIGASFRITRERTRQIVEVKENQILTSQFRLPLASEVVGYLGDAGGALPDSFFRTLLKYAPIHASDNALRVLPRLSALGLVPQVAYYPEFDLWVDATGKERWIDNGRIQTARMSARRVVGRHLRYFGGLHVDRLAEASPFGAEHAATLGAPNNAHPIRRGDYVVYAPLRDTALRRSLAKTLAITNPLSFEDVIAGLRQMPKFRSVSRELVHHMIELWDEYAIQGEHVRWIAAASRSEVLSPAEIAGVEVMEQNGNAMTWRDFIKAMVARGFSEPMAWIVLRRPYMRRAGSSVYRLRGREVTEAVRAQLAERRKELRRFRQQVTTEPMANGGVRLTIQLSEFNIQGVLPAPTSLNASGRHWTASLPDGREIQVKVANGFVWSFAAFFRQLRVRAGDRVRLIFDPSVRLITINHEQVSNGDVPRRSIRVRSRDQRILSAVFRQHELDQQS